MKRDLELIRTILFEAERIDPDRPFLDPAHFQGVRMTVLGEHFKLISDAGLAEAFYTEMGNGTIQPDGIARLLGPGHDLLDSIRNDTVWEKTKDKLASSVAGTSLDIVKAVATQFLRSQLGLDG